MYYEINVALNGRHFFATAPRSIQSESELSKVYTAFLKKFPPEEGFTMTIKYNPEVAYGVNPETLKPYKDNTQYFTS